MIREAIDKVVRREDLSEAQAREVFDEIMSGKATDAQIGAFAAGLRMKGETVDEITGAARAMREKSVKISIGPSVPGQEALVDTCGTGGSRVNTFNISTTVAFVTAGCGVKVAKHGNRSASGVSGSADVLEELGVKIDVSPDLAQRCLSEIGIGFLYAPIYHSAMKHAASARKDIGIRTIFNLLGPLSNPAGAASQVVGVSEPGLTGTMAGVFKNLGSGRVLVVHGEDSLDEITITGRTRVSELRDGRIRNYTISPEKFGLRRAGLDAIRGGDRKENARILISVLKGERSPRRDIVTLNAAASLVAGYKAGDIRSGIAMAAESIDSGSAFDKLNGLIEMTNR